MTKNADIHGIFNALVGTILALFSILYYSELPGPLIPVLIATSWFLILREIWMQCGKVRWTITRKMSREQ